ncbi:ACT domain-containing protein ACR10-like [Zingiber officinale]|uniref:ACT domain-containing protein ACR10-like n=1 Tax=Zingiber officinale TaxID=94328 RepID=UPI001C4CD78E|nr:ACT domain-containing protein ACR10-like [Zingiber officinale]XP_042394700.1 ACT domain-containing protein ACR10-like [Zingiber officinale]
MYRPPARDSGKKRMPESLGGAHNGAGLGCDLCRVILLFGLSIVRGDFSMNGRWCYVLLWVAERGRKETRWDLLKKRLVVVCPSVSPSLVREINSRDQEMDAEQKPQVFLLKFSCYDRMGLLHGDCTLEVIPHEPPEPELELLFDEEEVTFTIPEPPCTFQYDKETINFRSGCLN